jgi:hypothetical protein
MSLKISQRAFTTIVVFVIALGLAAIAVYNGYRLPSLRNITVDELLTFFLPLTGVVFILNSFYDVLDSKVLDGSLEAGDWLALFRMPSWYSTVVACAAGCYQFFGGQLISADTQVMIVALLQSFVYLLLRSFSNRLPSEQVTVSQKAYEIKVVNNNVNKAA